MKPYMLLFFTLIAAIGYSQSSPEDEVFKKIIDYTIVTKKNRFYIQCKKTKSLFHLNSFKRVTTLKVPATILEEINNNTKHSQSGTWDSVLLLDPDFGNWIQGEKCLTQKEVQSLIKKDTRPLTILSIGDPVFDASEENCVVSITFLWSRGGSHGQSYFLKKVYGVWVIVDTYNIWMS